MKARVLPAAALLGLLGLATLITAQDKKEPATTKANEVTIEDNKFTPATITVKVGDSVKWVNKGDNPHTATSKDIKTGDLKKTFNTGVVKKGQHAELFFNVKGEFKYECVFHNGMEGTVKVE